MVQIGLIHAGYLDMVIRFPALFVVAILIDNLYLTYLVSMVQLYIDGDYLSKLVRSTDFLAYSFRIPRCMKMRLLSLSLSNFCCHPFPFSSVGGCDGLLSPSRH